MLNNFTVSRGTCLMWCPDGCMLLLFPSNMLNVHCTFRHLFWLILLPDSLFSSCKSGTVLLMQTDSHFCEAVKPCIFCFDLATQKSTGKVPLPPKEPGFHPRFYVFFKFLLYTPWQTCNLYVSQIAADYIFYTRLLSRTLHHLICSRNSFGFSALYFICLIYFDINDLTLVVW